MTRLDQQRLKPCPSYWRKQLRESLLHWSQCRLLRLCHREWMCGMLMPVVACFCFSSLVFWSRTNEFVGSWNWALETMDSLLVYVGLQTSHEELFNSFTNVNLGKPSSGHVTCHMSSLLMFVAGFCRKCFIHFYSLHLMNFPKLGHSASLRCKGLFLANLNAQRCWHPQAVQKHGKSIHGRLSQIASPWSWCSFCVHMHVQNVYI